MCCGAQWKWCNSDSVVYENATVEAVKVIVEYTDGKRKRDD